MGHKLKWVSPHRKAYLARLMAEYLALKGWQLDLLSGEFYHPVYEARIRLIIADWIAEDRAEAQAEWQAEQRAIHNLAERGPLRGEFNATGRDVFYAEQPLYYQLGLGISGLTFRPFAKVRLSSTFTGLHVELGDILHGVSKSRRRKAIRYGKPLTRKVQGEIDAKCNKAVRHYLKI